MRGLKSWAAAGVALTGIAAAALAGVATAEETPPPGFTWYVLNQLNEFYFDIEDPTNRPPLVIEAPKGVLVPVNINDDGRTDWLINWPQETQFCGTGGCQRSLYVSDGPNFIRAFDRQGGDIDIRKVNGETRIETSFHHLYCNDAVEDCRMAWGWDPRTGRLEERPTRRGEHILQGSGESAVDLGEKDGQPVLPDWIPETLLAQHQAGRRVCPTGEGEETSVVYPTLGSIPDLNGDGIRDWTIGPPVACQGDEKVPYGFQVWISVAPGQGPHGEGGEVVMAYRAAEDRWMHLDVGQTPARLIDAPTCESGKTCPGVTLTWDAASRALRP